MLLTTTLRDLKLVCMTIGMGFLLHVVPLMPLVSKASTVPRQVLQNIYLLLSCDVTWNKVQSLHCLITHFSSSRDKLSERLRSKIPGMRDMCGMYHGHWSSSSCVVLSEL